MRITELFDKAARLQVQIDEQAKQLLLEMVDRQPLLELAMEMIWQRKEVWKTRISAKSSNSVVLFWSADPLLYKMQQGKWTLHVDLTPGETEFTERVFLDRGVGCVEALTQAFRLYLALEGDILDTEPEDRSSDKFELVRLYRGDRYSLIYVDDEHDPHETMEFIIMSWDKDDLRREKTLGLSIADARTELFGQ